MVGFGIRRKPSAARCPGSCNGRKGGVAGELTSLPTHLGIQDRKAVILADGGLFFGEISNAIPVGRRWRGTMMFQASLVELQQSRRQLLSQ